MNWYKISKEVKGHKYSWVYIDLPKDIQAKMLELGKQIDPEDLYEDEADGGIETEPHVTVKYGLTIEDFGLIKECLDEAKGGKVYLGKSSIFEKDEYDVVKIDVESETLDKLHEKLNKLPHNDKYMDYHPHATIAYVKPGKGKKYIGKLVVHDSFKIRECFFGNSKKDYKIKLAKVFNLSRMIK